MPPHILFSGRALSFRATRNDAAASVIRASGDFSNVGEWSSNATFQRAESASSDAVRNDSGLLTRLCSREDPRREYYLLECKWEKEPIEAGVIRELLGKLGNRVGVDGIVMSMSGFSKGAVEQTETYAGQRVILLFGEEGIKKLVYGPERFTDLLNIKYRQLATKRKAEFT